MQQLDNEEPIRNQVKTLLAEIDKYESKSLIRKDALGQQLSFEDGLPILKRFAALFSDLKKCQLDVVPQNTLNAFHAVASGYKAVVEKMRDFKVEGVSDPINARDRILTELYSLWNSNFSIIVPMVTYLRQQSGGTENLLANAQEKLDRLTKMEAEFSSKSQDVSGSMERALDGVRKAAREAGVVQEATHFKAEAKLHADRAKSWLRTTIIFGVLIGLFAIWGHPLVQFLTGAIAQDTNQMIALAVTRVLIFSVLSFGMVWSARNYRSNQHNHVVNRHRMNALQTFQAFVEGSSDPRVKDAVLLQAAQAIYSPQGSGYTKGEAEPRPSNQIVEFVRSVTTDKE